MGNISGLSKAAVLRALYDASKQRELGGLGALDPRGRRAMTLSEAQAVVEERGDDLYFDYLNGRVLKVDLKGDRFDPRLYDRDNGTGAAQRAIGALRADRA